jgi:hypothetical protein
VLVTRPPSGNSCRIFLAGDEPIDALGHVAPVERSRLCQSQ